MPESLAREIGLLRTLAAHLERRPLPLERLTPLFLSGAIYLLTWHFGWHLHSYPTNGSWCFNPLAWQCSALRQTTSLHHLDYHGDPGRPPVHEEESH
jgi:hypothetical protein